MNNKDKILNLLGLANRARKIISGEDSVEIAISKKQVYLLFIASDASIRTKDKFSKKAYFYNIVICDSFSCEELSNSIGKPMRKIVGVVDRGFAKTLKELIRGDEDEG